MNEDRTEKYLRQMEHIRGHLWYRYSVTVNQVMVATVKLQLNQNQKCGNYRLHSCILRVHYCFYLSRCSQW